VIVFVAVWAVVTLALAYSTSYYRNGWLSTEQIRLKHEGLVAKEGRINEKLTQMEQVVGRAGRLASTLEAVVGINKKIMTKSIGPIAENDHLPDARALATPRKYDLGESDDNTAAFSDLEIRMDELSDVVSSVEMRLQQVYEYHQDKLAYWASVPSIWPVRGWVTSEFGVRRSPRGIGTRFHEGIDIAASTGTPIYASGDGVVTFAGYKPGLGKTVIIDHGFGLTTVYGHNSQLYVKDGDRVKRGVNISAVGRTGRSTGPHLHYQIEVDGIPVDPMRYIIENF
jgi:murein DD-endopeptidase MepM/ murein hydrolase activator NlpD